ncbi:MAG: DUF349 domain-containing protein [Bacteroidota bacterium]
MQENDRKLQETEADAPQLSESTQSSVEESPISEPDSPENTSDPITPEAPSAADTSPEEPPEEPDEVLDEIEQSNAEDAEDEENKERHHIPFLDYHAMPLENLVGELQRLVKNEKIQAINRHVASIKHEFDQKFQEFLEQKKEDFVTQGGNEIDFRYNSVAKRQFNEVFAEYREKRDSYYKQLEQNLKINLQKRLDIIEELKGLVNVEEDINTTYKNFKDIQARWKVAGAVPRNQYNDVWRTYHHHMEIFYDFLHLNRELRDLDFKHNLEEKLKLAEKAEALADEGDLGKAFRELQTLHKIWKEDIGPVAKDEREQIWERFSNATKALHERRQEHFKELEKVYEENLVVKQGIINSIAEIADNVKTNHKGLQEQIKQIEALRESFFKAGKVPQKNNEETWAAFKETVRKFNRGKNAFYKNQKKEQHVNLEKKRELLQLAISLKDSDDWETVTPQMKKIQSDWKKIGHVPRKYSDKIWAEFKEACNHYFNRLHAERNQSQKEEFKNLDLKNACLERLKAFQLSGNKEKDLEVVKTFIKEWKGYGRIPHNKKHINGKFHKIIDALFRKLGVDHQQSELIKYGDKMQQLAKGDDDQAIRNERIFIRRKISEAQSEIRQLENNLQFFSNASGDSPLVKEVVSKIDKHKATLETWQAKLKKLNILQHNRAKGITEEPSSTEEE